MTEEPDVIIADKPTFISNYDEGKINIKQVSRTIVLTTDTDHENVNDLLNERIVKHWVPIEKDRLQAALIMNIALKITGLPKDRFKFDVGQKIKIDSHRIRNSKDIQGLIEKLIGELDFEGNFKGTGGILRLLSSELCTNAVFNAPRGKSEDKSRYAHIERNEEIILSEKEEVNFCFFSDKEKFGVYVKDNFGSLDFETVVHYIYRGFNEKDVLEDKSGGHGAGMYMTFKNTDRFIVNSRKDVITEFILVLDREKRMKKFRNRAASFSFYEM